MEESDAGREERLYEPIKAALQEKFRAKGICMLEIAARQISDDVKKRFPSTSLLFLKRENMFPDMIGYLELRGLLFKMTKRVVVEVKIGQMTLSDIYQLKMYAEVLGSYYAFLISPSDLREEQKHDIANSLGVLTFNGGLGRGEISIMHFVDGTLSLDEELCKRNPFAHEFVL